MATIRNRGEYQLEAQIRRKGYPAQRKTFETKADAQAWARMIESEIDRGIFVSRVEAERTAFHELIDRYISEVAPKHKGSFLRTIFRPLPSIGRKPTPGKCRSPCLHRDADVRETCHAASSACANLTSRSF